jgi:hypothetical protein
MRREWRNEIHLFGVRDCLLLVDYIISVLYVYSELVANLDELKQLICEAIETATSDKRMCVRVEFNYWLDRSCHKGSIYEVCKLTEVIFTSVFFFSVCIMIKNIQPPKTRIYFLGNFSLRSPVYNVQSFHYVAYCPFNLTLRKATISNL